MLDGHASGHMMTPHFLRVRMGQVCFGGMIMVAVALCADARPTATQDTGTADFGHWESEIGFEHEVAPDGRQNVVAPAFTYGLTPRLETEVSWDYVMESPEDEAPARRLLTAFEFKGRFWEPKGEEGPSAGVKGKFAVPANVSGPQGSTDPEGYLKFIYARPFGAAELDWNVGYKYRGAWSAGGNDRFFAGVCLRYRVGPRWQWLAEIHADPHEHREHETTGVAAAGFKWKVRPGLKGDLLVGTGLGRGAPELQISVGLVWQL